MGSVPVRAQSLQSCLTLHSPMDCSPPASSVHGDSPGKNTGVVATSYYRVSSRPRDRTRISYVFCIGRQILHHQRHCPGLAIIAQLSLSDLDISHLSLATKKRQLHPWKNNTHSPTHMGCLGWVQSQAPPFMSCVSLVNYFTSLCLSVLTSKIVMIIQPTS